MGGQVRALVLVGLVACASPSASRAAEAAYGAALLQCVDQAKTLQESKACRAKVDAEWGIVQRQKDGGS